MAKVLIVYYSKSGNTKKMAELVGEGVEKEGGVDLEIKSTEAVAVDELLDADGIIIGSPTYFGTMAWPVKKLFDDSITVYKRLEGKIGGAFTSSGVVGGGNETTIMNIIKAMLIHGMTVGGFCVGDHYGPVSIGVPDERAAANCRRLGEKVAGLVKRLTGTLPK